MNFNSFFKNIFFFDAAEQFDIYAFKLGGNLKLVFLGILFTFLISLFFVYFAKSDTFFFIINYFLNLVKITVENNMSDKNFNYTAYLSIFYAMFFLILFFNLGGLIPFSYTITSLLVMPFFYRELIFFLQLFLRLESTASHFLEDFCLLAQTFL